MSVEAIDAGNFPAGDGLGQPSEAGGVVAARCCGIFAGANLPFQFYIASLNC